MQTRVTRLLDRVPLKSKVNERLRKGLLKHHQRGNLLRFLEDPGIPPTNNAAERALRSGVIARKVSQCSKTQRGATAHRLGKRLIAAAQYLHHGLGLPERRVPEVLSSLCGVEVTQSALNQATIRTTAAGTLMATAYQQIGRAHV